MLKQVGLQSFTQNILSEVITADEVLEFAWRSLPSLSIRMTFPSLMLLNLMCWLQAICAVVLNHVSVPLSTALADEQQSYWTHALVCLFKSRRLQSYWLMLCSDHSNNQADPQQKTLEWASFTTEAIWNTLWLLCGVLYFDLANGDNANILLSKAA